MRLKRYKEYINFQRDNASSLPMLFHGNDNFYFDTGQQRDIRCLHHGRRLRVKSNDYFHIVSFANFLVEVLYICTNIFNIMIFAMMRFLTYKHRFHFLICHKTLYILMPDFAKNSLVKMDNFNGKDIPVEVRAVNK